MSGSPGDDHNDAGRPSTGVPSPTIRPLIMGAGVAVEDEEPDEEPALGELPAGIDTGLTREPDPKPQPLLY